jgi:hypothetical protein
MHGTLLSPQRFIPASHMKFNLLGYLTSSLAPGLSRTFLWVSCLQLNRIYTTPSSIGYRLNHSGLINMN